MSVFQLQAPEQVSAPSNAYLYKGLADTYGNLTNPFKTLGELNQAWTQSRDSETAAEVIKRIQNEFEAGKSLGEAQKALEAQGFTARDFVNADTRARYKNYLDDLTTKDSNTRAWNSDARDQQRVNLTLRTYADTRGDIKRSRENTDLFNQYTRLLQIDPEAAKQWYRDNKEKLNSPEYADANTLILALTAKAGTSTQTSPGVDIPNDYAITPEEYTPAKTLLHNELASQGAAVPFIQSMIKGTVQPYSEADKGLLDTVKNDPDKYNKLLGSINEAKAKLKAKGIPEDIAAYVLQNAPRSTFFNGIEFNHDALIAEAEAIRKSAQDNGTKIRKLLQYDKVLGDDSNYLSNQVATRDQKFRVIDRALAEKDFASPELANEAKRKADSDLYSNTRDKQSILNGTKRARETRAAEAAAIAKEKAGTEELARMRQEASSIKDPTKRAVWLANIDRKYKALSESTAKAKADADRAKQMLYDLNLGF